MVAPTFIMRGHFVLLKITTFRKTKADSGLLTAVYYPVTIVSALT
jgi:hypothetical protein